MANKMEAVGGIVKIGVKGQIIRPEKIRAKDRLEIGDSKKKINQLIIDEGLEI
ncbi:MAG: hypothetical protein KAT65_00720 [Methanophagales archaeon]|nr:hypothetical protein [Methanophagales archaeon]